MSNSTLSCPGSITW